MTASAVEYEQLLTAAAPYLHLRHPGHANQKVHGRRHGMSADEFDQRRKAALTDQDDIDHATELHGASRNADSALGDYVGDYKMNGELRANKGDASKVSGYSRDLAAGLDEAFAGHRALDRDIVVTRGIADMDVTFGGREPKQGMTWVEHGFASTSSRPFGHGEGYHGDSGAQMRLLIPKGAKVISHRNLTPSENLVQRGYKFRVVRDNGTVDGIRQLDVEVIPG